MVDVIYTHEVDVKCARTAQGRPPQFLSYDDSPSVRGFCLAKFVCTGGGDSCLSWVTGCQAGMRLSPHVVQYYVAIEPLLSNIEM